MKKLEIFSLVILFIFFGCNNSVQSNDLELSLLNENIVCYSKNSTKDSINVVKYSLKNNSNKIYFINNLIEQSILLKSAVYKNGINLLVYDSENRELNYEIKRYRHEPLDNDNCFEFLIEDFKVNKERLKNSTSLKYLGLYERNNIFFIHPNETVFFQYSINLIKAVNFDGVRQGFVSLNPNKEYFTKLSIASDSTNYKNVLPRDILKTIEVNNVKVYHGIIESKNKVPIKVIE